MKKTDESIEKFKKLKESGKNISLGDIFINDGLKGEQKGVITSLNKILSGEISHDNIEYLKKFHKKAFMLEKENLSQIVFVEFDNESFPGYTFTEKDKLNKIFLVDNDVVIEVEGEEAHELGIYELN